MRKKFRKTKKIKKKGSILKNMFFWLGVSIAALTELLLYVVVLFPLFQIQEVRIQGNEEVSENNIKSVILSHLWREFFFFPTASILLVDTRGIQDDLLETILELEIVSIERELPNTLVVSVQEKRTVALWCPAPELLEATRCRATPNRIADGDSGSGCQELHCLALDKEGIAFKKADPSPDFPIIGSLEEASWSLGETIVKKNALLAVLAFSKEVSVSSFTIVSENQIHANIFEGWSVYFTQTQDLSWQIIKLQTVLENKIPPEKRRKLEYIDVRFGDQAYFKYR